MVREFDVNRTPLEVAHKLNEFFKVFLTLPTLTTRCNVGGGLQHLTLPKARITDNKNMWIGTYRQLVLFTSLSTSKQSQHESRFHQLVPVDGRTQGAHYQPKHL